MPHFTPRGFAPLHDVHKVPPNTFSGRGAGAQVEGDGGMFPGLDHVNKCLTKKHLQEGFRGSEVISMRDTGGCVS